MRGPRETGSRGHSELYNMFRASGLFVESMCAFISKQVFCVLECRFAILLTQ